MTDKIKVGPIHYQVRTVDNLTSRRGEDMHGEVDHSAWEIRLNNGHTPESRLVTLWHEVLHGLEGVYGLNLNEKTITTLAPLIVQLLQDNEELRQCSNE